jgi:hypothetical protein
LRGHAREMERERVKAYDSDDFNDIFGIGGAFRIEWCKRIMEFEEY